MALESKPLFHPEVLRQHVRAFSLPAHVAALQPKLDHWADLIASGQADELKETALLPDFLTEFFIVEVDRPDVAGNAARMPIHAAIPCQD
jgi:hypothetical protein